VSQQGLEPAPCALLNETENYLDQSNVTAYLL